MPTSLTNDLKRLRALKQDYDRKRVAAKKAEAEHKKFQAKVFSRMEAEGVQSISLGGKLFVRSATTYAAMQDRSEFVEWAQANDPELVEVKEREALLNALVRERLDNGDVLPPGVGFSVREVVAQRAA